MDTTPPYLSPLRFRMSATDLAAAISERIRALRESQRLMREIVEANRPDDAENAAIESSADDFNVEEQTGRLLRLHKYLVPAEFYDLSLDEMSTLLPTVKV